MRRIYDTAKTPLQRLLLSGVLSASAQHELEHIVQALDPLDLAAQVEQLQTAVFRCAAPSSSSPSAEIRRFVVESCLCEPLLTTKAEDAPGAHAKNRCEDANTRPSFLNWQRSRTNPFASEWDRILAWVRTHPEGSTRELLEALQQLFPGQYQASQYPAIQRGVSKMRAYLRDCTVEDLWPIEVIHGSLETTGFAAPIAQEEPKEASFVPSSSIIEPEGTPSPETPVETDNHRAKAPSVVQDQERSTTFSSACEKEICSICVPAGLVNYCRGKETPQSDTIEMINRSIKKEGVSHDQFYRIALDLAFLDQYSAPAPPGEKPAAQSL